MCDCKQYSLDVKGTYKKQYCRMVTRIPSLITPHEMYAHANGTHKNIPGKDGLDLLDGKGCGKLKKYKPELIEPFFTSNAFQEKDSPHHLCRVVQRNSKDPNPHN